MPHLRPTGGILFRQSSPTTVTAYDVSGNILFQVISGKLSLSGNRGTVVTNTPIASVTATSAQAIGVSVQFTPQVSTSAFVFGKVDGQSTSSAGWTFGLYKNTGSVNPAGGSGAVPGVSNVNGAIGFTGSFNTTLSIFGIEAGLTVGQAYTWCAGIATGTASTTCSFNAVASLTAQVFEI